MMANPDRIGLWCCGVVVVGLALAVVLLDKLTVDN